MKIKVCGITCFEQIQELQSLGADYAGMIFYEGSKRFAGNKIGKEKAQIRSLQIKKAGVFVNADKKNIEKAIEDYGLNAIQLHGEETPEFCRALKNKTKLIKAFRISGGEKIEEIVESFEEVCDYFLFDTNTSQYGGSGKQFDWNILKDVNINKPFFLSGGIGLEDIEKLKKFSHTNFYAADVNSRFEVKPGVKDLKKIKQFIQSIHHG